MSNDRLLFAGLEPVLMPRGGEAPREYVDQRRQQQPAAVGRLGEALLLVDEVVIVSSGIYLELPVIVNQMGASTLLGLIESGALSIAGPRRSLEGIR